MSWERQLRRAALEGDLDRLNELLFDTGTKSANAKAKDVRCTPSGCILFTLLLFFPLPMHHLFSLTIPIFPSSPLPFKVNATQKAGKTALMLAAGKGWDGKLTLNPSCALLFFFLFPRRKVLKN